MHILPSKWSTQICEQPCPLSQELLLITGDLLRKCERVSYETVRLPGGWRDHLLKITVFVPLLKLYTSSYLWSGQEDVKCWGCQGEGMDERRCWHTCRREKFYLFIKCWLDSCSMIQRGHQAVRNLHGLYRLLLPQALATHHCGKPLRSNDKNKKQKAEHSWRVRNKEKCCFILAVLFLLDYPYV